jgi:hypothetical protein
MVLVIKVSNIFRRYIENRKLLLICILLLLHSFILFSSYFYQYMVVFLFNTIIYVFLLLGLCILVVRLPWLRFIRAFSSVARQMPGYNSQRRGTTRTLPYLSCSMYCLFLCCSVYCLFLCRSVLFVCKCVVYNCHRVATQLQLINISMSIFCFIVLFCVLFYVSMGIVLLPPGVNTITVNKIYHCTFSTSIISFQMNTNCMETT